MNTFRNQFVVYDEKTNSCHFLKQSEIIILHKNNLTYDNSRGNIIYEISHTVFSLIKFFGFDVNEFKRKCLDLIKLDYINGTLDTQNSIYAKFLEMQYEIVLDYNVA